MGMLQGRYSTTGTMMAPTSINDVSIDLAGSAAVAQMRDPDARDQRRIGSRI